MGKLRFAIGTGLGRGRRAALGLVRAVGRKGSIIALENAGKRVPSNDCGCCSGCRMPGVRGVEELADGYC